MFYLTVKHRAYPIRERYGLYWTYMGPEPVPVLPRYDVLEIAPLKSVELSYQDCNWLQVVENNLDQSHTVILHQNTRQRGPVPSTTRGLMHELERIEYTEAAFGIKRHRIDRTGYEDSDLAVFPTTARIYNHVAVKVPIDDTHTKRYVVAVDLEALRGEEPSGEIASNAKPEFRQMGLGKSPANAIHPVAIYCMDQLQFQDFMALETQGAIAPRQNERLATADQGVALMRDILKREIEKVQHGTEPIGVIRDPTAELIDTYIHNYVEMLHKVPSAVPGMRGADAGTA